MPKKTTISRAEYLQLLGLLTLARKHARIVHESEDLMAEILGDDGGGDISDTIFSEDRDLEEMLRRMEITFIEE